MLAHNIAASEFPILEQLRASIRAARVKPADNAEVQAVADHLSEAFTNNLIEGYEPDPEACALDRLFREERLPRADVARFYQQYINLKFRSDA